MPLTHLSDDQIEIVIHAVTEWCKARSVSLESESGRRAVAVAANLISGANVVDFRAQLHARLERHSN